MNTIILIILWTIQIIAIISMLIKHSTLRTAYFELLKKQWPHRPLEIEMHKTGVIYKVSSGNDWESEYVTVNPFTRSLARIRILKKQEDLWESQGELEKFLTRSFRDHIMKFQEFKLEDSK